MPDSRGKHRDYYNTRRHVILRIVRTIDPRLPATSVGQRLNTKAKVIGRGRSRSRDPDASLSAALRAPVQSARLYDLDGSGAVENLAAEIKAYWREHLAAESAD